MLVLSVHTLLFLGLLGLSFSHGQKVYAINAGVRKSLWKLRRTTGQLQQFVDAHQAEPGFSFAFSPAAWAWLETFCDVPLPVILFKPYLNNQKPAYLFILDKVGLVPIRYAHGLGLQLMPPRPTFPELERVGIRNPLFTREELYERLQAGREAIAPIAIGTVALRGMLGEGEVEPRVTSTPKCTPELPSLGRANPPWGAQFHHEMPEQGESERLPAGKARKPSRGAIGGLRAESEPLPSVGPTDKEHAHPGGE
jgi:hypothetical protein